MESDLISPPMVASELIRTWDRLQKSGTMRASLFTLIVIAKNGERTDYLKTITQKVVERFPCRILMITTSPSTEESIHARVSVIPSAGGDVACDFIEFLIPAIEESKIPFLILPHLLPDLPIYLLWAGPPEESPLSYALESLATRVIFDSETSSSLRHFATSLLSHHAKIGCDIGDLNWARTENWRELLAGTFRSPERLEQLRHLHSCRLRYNAAPSPSCGHPKIQAIYLQGWLASQLQWGPPTITPTGFTYGDRTIHLEPLETRTVPAGAVLSVDLDMAGGISYSFRRKTALPYQVDLILCDHEKCEIPTRYLFTKTQTGLSLVNEIGHTGTSEHYLNLLKYLASFG